MTDYIPIPQPSLTPEQIAVGKEVEIRRLEAKVRELEQRQAWIDSVGPPHHPDDERQWVLAYLSAQERVAALTQAHQQAVEERSFYSEQNGSAMETVGELSDEVEALKAQLQQAVDEVESLRHHRTANWEALGKSPGMSRPQAAFITDLKAELQQAVEALAMLIRESSNVANDHHHPRYTRLDEALVSAKAVLATHKEKG